MGESQGGGGARGPGGNPPNYKGPSWSSRYIITWLLVIAALVTFLVIGRRGFGEQSMQIDSVDFWNDYVQNRKIGRVEIIRNEARVEAWPASGVTFPDKVSYLWFATIPDDLKIVTSRLEEAGIRYRVRQSSEWWKQMIGPVLMAGLIFFFLYWFMWRSMRGSGAGNILSFGRSRARLVNRNQTHVTFGDVAGIEEAKEDVREIIEFLKNPRKFQRLGGRIPRGVLLVGPPGTGKTLLAKAIAGEADVPFFSISGSDFVEMFVGVGASRVRDLFRQAKESAPCIIFLDEIDAVGRRRGHGWGGGHDEREQTLNAILVEMDGFETDTEVVVIAASNRPDVLDPALLRPGRFDREVVIDMPDLQSREQILEVHARKVTMSPDVDFHIVARGTPGFSGAELEAIINEAALRATLKGKSTVGMEDLEEARDKVRWGRQRRSRVLDEQDKLITAYHEGGHSLAAKLLPEVEPLHKVTIVPRGRSLGATMQLPEKDRYHYSRKHVFSTVTMLLAGRAAEELFCDDITTGASHDLKQATELVRQMVREWGMSERVGPIDYSETQDMLFGGEVVSQRNYSEAIALEIDQEIKRIIEEAYKHARSLLEQHAQEMKRLVEALVKYEVLTNEEVDCILRGKPLARELHGGKRAGEKTALAETDAAAEPDSEPGQQAAGGELRPRPA